MLYTVVSYAGWGGGGTVAAGTVVFQPFQADGGAKVHSDVFCSVGFCSTVVYYKSGSGCMGWYLIKNTRYT
jgi:hypothetical protein